MSDPQPAEQPNEYSPGSASFCAPRAAIRALIEAKADAITISAYLILACFTDATGVYSTAAAKSIRSRLAVDKARAQKALAALASIKVEGSAIVSSREAWIAETGEVLPDGPHERAKVLHVLPPFGETLGDRVWFGSGLVEGFEGFVHPLKALKNSGDVAARLLMLMYLANDMERFGGVPPYPNVYKKYETASWGYDDDAKPVDWVMGGFRVLHIESGGHWVYDSISLPALGIAEWPSITRKSGKQVYKDLDEDQKKKVIGLFWSALTALEHSGLIYEMVMALNRADLKDDDIQPLYELDCRSLHGYKPKGEEGLGGPLAKTIGEIGFPVTNSHGSFTGKYCAIVPRGWPLTVAGVYRLRFRVANKRNASVTDAWQRIRDGQRDARQWIDLWRREHKLPELERDFDDRVVSQAAARSHLLLGDAATPLH